MTDLNVVVVAGRLTRDPELKQISTGTSLLELSLAVNKSVKKNDEWEDVPSFFDVTIWGKQADFLSSKIVKGDWVVVNGSLEQQRWEKDGQKRSKVIINAVKLEFQKKGASTKIDDSDLPF